ncbi:MAG: hypothetical protein HC893_01360 [Chloroflexaceae bacterium]|nr:hypothetical protein [Chloroflexaceae bacterium]
MPARRPPTSWYTTPLSEPRYRHAPLDADEYTFLLWYLNDIASRARPYLDDMACILLDRLIEPASPMYLLQQPDFYVTYINMVACGIKTGHPHSSAYHELKRADWTAADGQLFCAA